MQAKGEGALGQQFGWIMRRLRTESRSQNTPCMSISHIIAGVSRDRYDPCYSIGGRTI